MTLQKEYLRMRAHLKDEVPGRAPSVLLFQMLVAIFTYSGCGTTSSPPPPPPPAISVSVSPSTAIVPSGATIQFNASVANTTDQIVTWEVKGATGQNSNVGTISESGLYSAPAMQFDPMSVIVSAVSKADPTRSASAAVDVLTAHRIGVRQVNGIGEFFDRMTGNTFTPRGNNYIRQGSQQLFDGQIILAHSTFNVGLYDPSRSEAALSQMQSNGYNTVRVFIEGCCLGGIGNPAGGISSAYVVNFVDFLTRARAHNIFVMPTDDFLPDFGGYTDLLNAYCCSTFAGGNLYYLTQGGVDDVKLFSHDFVQALIAQKAPLDVILAYELRNELSFESNLPPLTFASGTVTTANGQTYDMADPAAKQRMMDDNLTYWIDQARTAIVNLDPSAMVTVGFFPPPQLDPSRIGDPSVIEPYPSVANSNADFADLHMYPGSALTLAQQVQNYGFTGFLSKPVMMGEFGAFKSDYATTVDAASTLQSWQVGSCQYNVKGWLLWTWDDDEETELWNALSGTGEINQSLAPTSRPDPCK